MVEPSIFNVFIKIKHHLVKINLLFSTDSNQLITFANHHQVWNIDALTKKTSKHCIMHIKGMTDITN